MADERMRIRLTGDDVLNVMGQLKQHLEKDGWTAILEKGFDDASGAMCSRLSITQSFGNAAEAAASVNRVHDALGEITSISVLKS